MSKLVRVLVVVSILSFGSAVLITPKLGLLSASHAEASISEPILQQTDIAPSSQSETISTSTTTIELVHEPLAKVPETPRAAAQPQQPAYPVRLSIPSIKLSNAVIPVGINGVGEMDVPSGSTSNVGWYKYGTVPGNTGSAVMDAHVFAAFSNLDKLRVGDAIDVVMSDGTTLRFIVSDTETYALVDVPAETLFNSADGRHLNLITCAGTLLPNHSTYDHRLIVYATLDESSR